MYIMQIYMLRLDSSDQPTNCGTRIIQGQKQKQLSETVNTSNEKNQWMNLKMCWKKKKKRRKVTNQIWILIHETRTKARSSFESLNSLLIEHCHRHHKRLKRADRVEIDCKSIFVYFSHLTTNLKKKKMNKTHISIKFKQNKEGKKVTCNKGIASALTVVQSLFIATRLCVCCKSIHVSATTFLREATRIRECLPKDNPNCDWFVPPFVAEDDDEDVPAAFSEMEVEVELLLLLLLLLFPLLWLLLLFASVSVSLRGALDRRTR